MIIHYPTTSTDSILDYPLQIYGPINLFLNVQQYSIYLYKMAEETRIWRITDEQRYEYKDVLMILPEIALAFLLPDVVTDGRRQNELVTDSSHQEKS